MAVINLAVTIPDNQVARMQAALQTWWGLVEDPPGSGQFRDLTNAELTERLRQGVVRNIRDIVKRVEADAAKAAAEAGVTEPNVT
jgi:hypothetical protein